MRNDGSHRGGCQGDVRMKYTVCPNCGANIDNGEKCDCTKEKPHFAECGNDAPVKELIKKIKDSITENKELVKEDV